MPARIFAKFGEMRGKAFQIDGDMLIGRAKTNQIVLSHKLVSNRHARIYKDLDLGCYMIEDLDSLNGTILDGTPLRRPRRLGHIHIVNFGGCSDFFFIDPSQVPSARGSGTKSVVISQKAPKDLKDGEKRKTFMGKAFVQTPAILSQEPKPPESSKQPETKAKNEEKRSTMFGQKHAAVPKALIDKLGSHSEPKPPQENKCLVLKMFDVGGRSLSFELSEGENLIGRGEGLAVRIVDGQMSRHHAIIKVTSGKAKIRDLGSTNLTFVNGKRLKRETDLKSGDTIAFGELKGKIELQES